MGKAARLVGARAGQQEAGDPFHRQVGDGLISNPKPALPELFRIMHAIAEFLVVKQQSSKLMHRHQ